MPKARLISSNSGRTTDEGKNWRLQFAVYKGKQSMTYQVVQLDLSNVFTELEVEDIGRKAMECHPDAVPSSLYYDRYTEDTEGTMLNNGMLETEEFYPVSNDKDWLQKMTGGGGEQDTQPISRASAEGRRRSLRLYDKIEGKEDEGTETEVFNRTVSPVPSTSTQQDAQTIIRASAEGRRKSLRLYDKREGKEAEEILNRTVSPVPSTSTSSSTTTTSKRKPEKSADNEGSGKKRRRDQEPEPSMSEPPKPKEASPKPSMTERPKPKEAFQGTVYEVSDRRFSCIVQHTFLLQSNLGNLMTPN